MGTDDRVLTRPFALLVGGHFLQAIAYASLVLLPVYLDHLQASRTQVGVVMAAAALGGLVVRPLVAWALDRVGRKPTLLAGTAVLGASMLSIGLVTAMGPLIVLIHALVGVGQAMLMTGYFTFAADVIPERRRTEGLALFGVSGLVPLVVTPLADGVGIGGADLRWFFPFVGLLVASSTVFVLPLREQAIDAADPPSLHDVALSLRSPDLWPVWFASILFGGLVAVAMAYLTVIAAARNMPWPGAIWLTYAFGAVIVRLVGGTLPDRLGPTRMIPPSLLVYVAALVLIALGSGQAALLLAGLLAGIGHGYGFPVLSAQAVSRTPRKLRGSAMALFTAIWDVARLLLVPAAGILADVTSDSTMLLVFAAFAVLGLGLWRVLEQRTTARLPAT